MPMAQRMPLQLTVSCFSKIQIGLPFWYRLTQVVLDKVPLNGCVCVTFCFYFFICESSARSADLWLTCSVNPFTCRNTSHFLKDSHYCSRLHSYLLIFIDCRIWSALKETQILVAIWWKIVHWTSSFLGTTLIHDGRVIVAGFRNIMWPVTFSGWFPSFMSML